MDDTNDPTEEATAALDEARVRLASVPADVVVANHAMGLYELAAIHLSAPVPDLESAQLAIDALAALVEGLGERLGEPADALAAALAQIRLAYVSLAGR